MNNKQLKLELSHKIVHEDSTDKKKHWHPPETSSVNYKQ